MNEKIYLNRHNVKVTNNEFIVNGHSYSISQIESVSLRELVPNRMLALASMILGIILLINEGTFFAIGGVLLLIGFIASLALKTKYAIVVQMATKELRAYVNAEREFVVEVLTAVTTAKENKSQFNAPLVSDKDSEEQTEYISRIPTSLE